MTKPVSSIASGDIAAPPIATAPVKNFGNGKAISPSVAPSSIEIQIGFKNILNEKRQLSLGFRDAVPYE